MKEYYSAAELITIGLPNFPKTEAGIHFRAAKQKWTFREVQGKGGRNKGLRKEYSPPDYVKEEIRKQEAERLLEQTQSVALVEAPKPLAVTLESSTEAQRRCEAARMSILAEVDKLIETGVSQSAAINALLVQARQPGFEQLAATFRLAADNRGGAGNLPNIRTVNRWVRQRKQHSLLPKLPQRKMDIPDWLPLFLKFYQLPQKPSVATAYEIFCQAMEREQPLAKLPSVHQVRRALEKMGNVSRERGRKGARELKNDLPFTRREFLHLKPAEIYTADGHTFDAEVLNPLSGLPFRPEITTVLDVATRRCMGWSVGLAESRFTVLEALCHASLTAIGAIWYVDWGKGFENLMMTDEATGIMGRLGMTMKHSRAYNSQARGASERSHQIFTKAAKLLPSYVGKDMDPEARKSLFHITKKEIKLHGKIVNSPIPTWDEFKAFVEHTIEQYNNRPHRSLLKFTDQNGQSRHMTPNEMWALRVAEFGEPPKVDEADQAWLFRPQVMRTVRRGEVSLFSNVYFSMALQEFNGDLVRVSYDIHDAQWVWIYDDEGRLICKAEWNGNSQSYMPDSVVAQAVDKRNEARLKRNDVKRENILAERRTTYIDQQNSINLGGVSLDMAHLKSKGEAAIQRWQHHDEVVDELEAVTVEPEPLAWQVPETPQERYALYLRLKDKKETINHEKALKWLERYPECSEFKALERQANAG